MDKHNVCPIPAISRFGQLPVTRFAICFLLVFGELAFGGMLAIAVPPFFEVERGFYRSSALVFLTAGAMTAVGFGFLALGGGRPGSPSPITLWIISAVWLIFCAVLITYFLTLSGDAKYLRARSYSLSLGIGLVGVLAGELALKPADLGTLVTLSYGVTAIFSSLVLGFAAAGMLFGHWYLIDPNLPVDYLRTIVRLLGYALIGNLVAIVLVAVAISLFGGDTASLAAKSLFGPNLILFTTRMLLGPIAALVLTWMTWQTLKIPQTMAATGLLYIAVMAVLVGELLGRFILFRTALPL